MPERKANLSVARQIRSAMAVQRFLHDTPLPFRRQTAGVYAIDTNGVHQPHDR
ncbi:hypothetical protein [Prevotella multiformis]|uniref:hypothetical protein n=1 Tax=Prevotella multiformis TaxID=282402 RepID=UPI0023F0E245|nr:hypothetical protein [Prevotella multiformis]